MRWFLFLVLLLGGIPSTGNAELPKWASDIGLETPPDVLLGEDLIVYMKPGDKAPYEGMLMDMSTATRWTLRGEWLQRQLRVDADLLRQVYTEELRYNVEVARVGIETRQKEIEALEKALRLQTKKLEAAQKVPFYRTARFGLVIGMVLSAAVTGGVIAVAN